MHLYNNSLVIMQAYATILYSLHAWVHPYVSTTTSIALLTICIKIDACRPALHYNTATVGRYVIFILCVYIIRMVCRKQLCPTDYWRAKNNNFATIHDKHVAKQSSINSVCEGVKLNCHSSLSRKLDREP